MAGVLTTTRAELRYMVAGLLGDVTRLTATAIGLTTSFIDTIHLSSGLEDPTNREFVFISGTAGNVGLRRRVLTFTSATGTITFAAANAATAVGDVIDIYNYRGQGHNIQDYDLALDVAQKAAYPGFLVMATATVSAFDQDSPAFTIPSALTHVVKVEYVDTLGDYYTIPKASVAGVAGWSYDPGTTTVTIRGDQYLAEADGLDLRITGGIREEPFSSDSSTTTIDPEWMMYEAAAFLCMQSYHKGENQKYNTSLYFKQLARERIPITRIPRTSVRE